jgi:hypothetical protein
MCFTVETSSRRSQRNTLTGLEVKHKWEQEEVASNSPEQFFDTFLLRDHQPPGKPMAIETLGEACRRTWEALSGLDCVLIGGAACILVGAQHTTKDLDILVPDDQRGRSLAEQPNFKTSPRGNETWFTSSRDTHHKLGIIAAKDVQQAFDCSTPTRMMERFEFWPPAFILNMKCAAWSTDDPMRTMDEKASDIEFLSNYMGETR